MIHVVADYITDLTGMLREVGEIDLPRLVARGDGATHPGAPDRGDPGWKAKGRIDYHYRDRPDLKRPEDVIPIRSHDFH